MWSSAILAFVFLGAAVLADPLPNPDQDFLENKVPCLDRSIRYRKRPTSLVKVRSTLSIIAIHSLSSVNMDLTADVYLTQTWLDRRCAFRGLPGQGTVLTLYSGQNTETSHPGLANLWQPDTHFLNAKRSAKPEVVTRILSVGIVETRTRFAITTSCPMDLRLFPMDRQVCSMVIQSSAHPDNELSYQWRRGANDSKLAFLQGLNYQDRMTTEIRLLAYRFRDQVKSKPDELSGDTYDQIVLDLFLERPLGYFMWEVYMPASFIVVISFTSFWLERSATPARVSLGVTTVLTITTLLSSSNSNLPPTAYPKAVGVFLAGCFVFTFLSLMEYSAASYLERRRILNQRRLSPQPAAADSEQHQRMLRHLNMGLQKASQQQLTPTGTPTSVRKRKLTMAAGELKDVLGWRPSAVDLYSRALFPATFALFQLIYWMTCLLSVPALPEDAVILNRNDY